jgi:uncharacterized protein YlxW (UPF0749 family)
MAQARTRSDPEISLFPFLSILVCLIGALVLLIVILTMVQSMMADGRSIEEVVRAREADKLRRELTVITKELDEFKKEVDPARKVIKELEEKKERFVLLRRRLSTSAEDKKKLDQQLADLQKKLEDAITQIEQMQKEQPAIKAAIAKLKAEIAARKLNINAKPKLIVQQTGSGSAGADTKLHFVECNASGIVVHRQEGEPLRITSGSIGTDPAYNEFLREIAADPKNMVLFLLRDDGLGSYNRAAGWADSNFSTLRTGKLPLPGQGEVDLSQFKPR